MLSRLSVNVSRKLLRTTEALQKLTECKFSYLACNLTNGSLRNDLTFNVYKHSTVNAIYLVRHQSTVDAAKEETVLNTQQGIPAQQSEDVIKNVYDAKLDEDLISKIPDAPVPLSEEVTNNVVGVLNGIEPSFTSIGLGGYGPVGLMEYLFEWLHVSCDMPWWLTIVTVSSVIKIATIPIAINTSRNSAKMQHILPQITEIQENLTQARNSGNTEEAALYAYKLQEILSKNQIKIISFRDMVLRIAAYVPLFMALREMATLPVESLKEGGLWWITDLTAPDPYYSLPLVISGTLYMMLNSSVTPTADPRISGMMGYTRIGVSVISFLFTMNFPANIVICWTVTNILTVGMQKILKLQKIKLLCNIPAHKVHTMKSIQRKKGFRQSFGEAWNNIKVSHKLSKHLHADEIQFNEAGKAPLKKTYEHNPVKSSSPGKSTAAILAKKK